MTSNGDTASTPPLTSVANVLTPSIFPVPTGPNSRHPVTQCPNVGMVYFSRSTIECPRERFKKVGDEHESIDKDIRPTWTDNAAYQLLLVLIKIRGPLDPLIHFLPPFPAILPSFPPAGLCGLF